MAAPASYTATAGVGVVDRFEHEFATMAAEPGVRLPGDRRLAARRLTATDGVSVPAELMALLTRYTDDGPSTPRSV